MKALVTGASGFVGTYLVEHLTRLGYEVYRIGRPGSSSTLTMLPIDQQLSVNPEDEDTLLRYIDLISPDQVYHLAGFSSVRESWNSPAEVFQANAVNSIHLFEAIRKSSVGGRVRVVTIGSSEEYGKIDASIPIKETSVLNPKNPYGLSKVSLGMLARHYFEVYDLQIIHTRPFNHIGPGQRLGFVASDLAKQVANIELATSDPIIKVGNLESERDFSDVRDIVAAYEALAKEGEAGQTYNVCSGTPTSIKTILESYVSMSANKEIRIVSDQALLRPIDIPRYVGDSTKIREAIGWTNKYTLKQSLLDVLNYWRDVVRSSKEFIRNG
ncbi:GDP-mannose 4,6-dehydratase [Cohnella ginsengisoli]|uniref:GDP-mannose 4,6-dehydratase n=1 Tax=Cohnella ginsengisoli TaxID=425004 RepID=A0A9X4QQG1_9BACL|nr:GDP-mannose 4,6-dehydratase [Cohnella ginsengisoli]MDG0794526.1 GDP-mannose 4,6-dehydratase [Cohnella ginsengisoli]